MEVADGKGDVKAVHRLAGVLQGKWKRGSTNIAKDKDGKILTTEEERLAVFKAFYEVKFASAPSISTDIVSTPIDILPGRDEPPEINLLAPTLKEVEMAVKCLSNEKSTGIDEIPIELFKASPEAIKELHNLITSLWEKEAFPDDWYQELFVNIYKNKGNKNDPANYRPICLLSHAYKAFAIIVLERIRDTVDVRIKEGQEGFRSGRGCRDNLFVLRAAINYALKKKINAEIVFIDFTQAFDTVSHDFLQIALRDHGIPGKLCKLIEVIYSNAIGRIKAAGGYKSEPFPISRGVLQGCILSPILFVLCLNSVWKRTSPGQGWQILPDWLLDELSYADDIGMISRTTLESQNRLQSFSDLSNQTSTMRINLSKTVRMTIAPKITVTKTTEEDIIADQATFMYKCEECHRTFPRPRSLSSHYQHCPHAITAAADAKPRRNQLANKIIEAKKRAIKVEDQAKIKLNGEFISNVEIFKYLGAKTTSYGSDEEEVEARILQALQAHRALKGIWKDKGLSLDIKIRLFKVRVLSILVYGAESWKMTKKIVQKIRGFIVRCFTNMTSHTITEEDKVSYRNIANIRARFIEAMSHIDIIYIIDKRRWQWLGHVLRMKHDRNIHKALNLLDFEPGSLLHHLHPYYHDLHRATELASNIQHWNEIFDQNIDFISLKTCFD